MISAFAFVKVNAQNNLQKINLENQKIVDESSPEEINFMYVTRTGSVFLFSNIRKSHRLFGYGKPNVKSEKLILFSVFTNDVENNPFQCKFGSYYESSAMKSKGLQLKFIKFQGDFAEMEIQRTFSETTEESLRASEKNNSVQNVNKTKVYFWKKYIKIDKTPK